jgi:acetoin utilization deacetylase AcuC-like enzyme
MPVVWSDRCGLHDPGGEIWVGVRTPGTEVPERADAILAALVDAGARVVDAEEHSDRPLLAVHDASLLEYLQSAWDEWVAAGLDEDPGQDRVVPYVFAHAGLTSGRPPAVPAAVWARPGYFTYDTMTLVGAGTWEAARGAVDAALTAVDLVLAGEPGAYALCRPPGHHACRSCFGGSCYLNNAAIAAAALVEVRCGAGCRSSTRIRTSRSTHACACAPRSRSRC